MKRLILALWILLLTSIEIPAQGLSPDVSGFLRDQNGNMQRVKYAFVNPSTATTTQVVAAQGTGIKIRVVAALCDPTAANTITFNSSTAGAISASFPVAAGIVLLLNYNPNGWFETAANEALQVVTSAATATGCQVAWISVSTSPLP